MVLPTLWWLFFFTALGLCIGSFANVLIHRLPLDRSPREPRWSACPHCDVRIRWQDNIPVLSYLLLRGRCRNCKLPISVRYPVVELGMAILFVAIADAFVLAGREPGATATVLGGTERLLSDWPILLAHLVLFFGLFVMSAIDLEHYWVDIRFTNAATIAGFILHMVWAPRHAGVLPAPAALMAVVALAVCAGVAAVWLLGSLAPWSGEAATGAGESEDSNDEVAGASNVIVSPYALRRGGGAGFLLLFTAVLALMWVLPCLGVADVLPAAQASASAPALVALFVLIVALGQISRPSDAAVYEAIEAERVSARRIALRELCLFVPALLFALLAGVLVSRQPTLESAVQARLGWEVASPGELFPGAWRPLAGLSTAAAGYVIGGGVGWLVRILFTVIFGKEAFGTGDIHMMAAAGCIAGWPVVVLGFFLACFLALLGWLAALPFKRTRAIPLGPWLSLAFLVVVLYYRPIVESRLITNITGAVTYLLDPVEPPFDGVFELPAGRAGGGPR